MKKLLLVATLAISTAVFGQNNSGKGIVGSTEAITNLQIKQTPSAVSMAKTNSPSAKTMGTDQVQALSCTDTLRYTQTKQIVLFPGGAGASNFATFSVWRADNEAISQTFKHAGGTSISIKGVEFYGNKSASSAAGALTVRASIYSVDVNGAPLTSLGSRTVSIGTSTVAAYRYVNFTTPIDVTGNYAVVLEATSTNGVLEYYVTSPTPGETMDGENLAYYKSSYYPKSAGAWVNIPTLTTGDATNFASGPYDFEPLIAPIVSYNINTAFTATPNPLCVGAPLTISNNTTPTDLLQNRMYNFGSFMHHFGQYPQDSLYLWDMGNGSPLIWDVNTAYTYTAAGTYTVEMGTIGGFWHTCFDIASNTVTVNAKPNVTATPASTAVCVGTNISLAGGGADTYTWTGGVTNGVSFTPTSTNYTVTGTAANGCTNSAVASVTVNTLPSITTTPASTAVCAGTNITLTGGGADTYTWTGGVTDGVAFAPASADYTVTGTDVNGCVNTAVTSVTVNALPNVTATPASTAVCAGTDISLTGGGSATTYTWTGGVINSSTFTPTSTDYTVTGTDANGCSNTAVASVTVNSAPTVSATASSAAICTGENVTLTGGGATSYSWTAGVTDNTPFSPTSTDTYTVTGYDINGCSSTATVEVTVSLCTGIQSLSNTSTNVIVFPNPNNGLFTIKSQKSDVITLTNELGQVIKTIELNQENNFSADINNLESGIYFLVGKSVKQKVVVTK